MTAKRVQQLRILCSQGDLKIMTKNSISLSPHFMIDALKIGILKLFSERTFLLRPSEMLL